MLNLKLMPMPPPGIMVDTMDTLDTMDTVMVWDTVDTTVDTTDTPTPMDTILARDLLMPNLKPKLMLKLNPGITDMVDTMDIHTEVTTDMPVPTMAVTGGNLALAILKPSCLNLPKFILPLSFRQTINYCPQKKKKRVYKHKIRP